MRLTIVLASFHTEFAKFTSIQTKIGQKELCGLSGKIHELNNLIREQVDITIQIPTDPLTVVF